NDQALAQSFAAAAIRQHRRDLTFERAYDSQCRRHKVLRNVGFIGKIDPRFNQRQRLDQLRSPLFSALSQRPSHLPKCKATLALRLCQPQICKTFHGGEIKFAVLECPSCELAGFRRTQSRHARKRSKDGGNDSPSTVQLELRHIFASLAVRCWKP